MIGGSDNNGDSSHVMKLNLTVDGKMEHLPDGPQLLNPLVFVSLIEWKGQLVVTGGKIGNDPQASTNILNTRQSPASWVYGPNLNTARYGHFSFLLGDTVYVGCGDNDSPLSSIEMMDFSLTNPNWTFTTNYPQQVTIITYTIALQLY